VSNRTNDGHEPAEAGGAGASGRNSSMAPLKLNGAQQERGRGFAGLPPEAYAVALARLPGAGPGWLADILSRYGPTEAWQRVINGHISPPRRAVFDSSKPWDDDGGTREHGPTLPQSATVAEPNEVYGLRAQHSAAAGAARLDPGVDSALRADGAAKVDLRAGYAEAARKLDVPALWDRCVRSGVQVTWPGAPGYPSSLEGGPGRPGVLFWVGDLAWVERCPVVALVGTRRCTPEGAATAYEIARELASAGVCVVSGLALGIDGAAHAGALEGLASSVAGQGASTVGVAASGVDVVYPRQHAQLWRRVSKAGAVVSETPPGTPAQPWRFPARNRVIAGLARMVVVVECHLTGGSWHTVDAALRWGVEVGAVPGSVRSPASDGTNLMIREGATPVRSASDVLDALGLVGHAAASVTVGEAAKSRPPRAMSYSLRSSDGRVGSSAEGRLSGDRPGLAPGSSDGPPGYPDGPLGSPLRPVSGLDGPDSRSEVGGPVGRASRPAGQALGPVEQKVLSAVGWRPLCLEDVVERSGLPVGAVAVALDRLEEAGAVNCEAGWWWRPERRR